MKFKVEAVSKYGIKSDTKWYNADKNSNVDFSMIKKGDEVELDLNDKGYFTKFTVVSFGVSGNNSRSGNNANRGNSGGYQRNPADNDQMARSVAVKAVLESEALREAAKSLGLGSAELDSFLEVRVQRYTNYIRTGSFDDTSTETK